LVRSVKTKGDETHGHKTSPLCIDKLSLFIPCNFNVITLTENSNIRLEEVSENPVDKIWNSTTGRKPHSSTRSYVLPERFSGEYVGIHKYCIAVTPFI